MEFHQLLIMQLHFPLHKYCYLLEWEIKPGNRLACSYLLTLRRLFYVDLYSQDFLTLVFFAKETGQVRLRIIWIYGSKISSNSSWRFLLGIFSNCMALLIYYHILKLMLVVQSHSCTIQLQESWNWKIYTPLYQLLICQFSLTTIHVSGLQGKKWLVLG